jgi:ABC-type branched-subunit amino acid transport system substrate-binding protein
MISTKFKVDPKLEHILGWEALWALTQGIEKAQSLDSTAVAKALETMDTIETPFGPGKMEGTATLGTNHVLVRPAALATLMNGEAKHVGWGTPVLP